MGQVPQTQAHDLTQRMGNLGQFLEVEGRIDLDVAEGVKILDRHIELLGEELRRIRHDGRAAGKEQLLRR